MSVAASTGTSSGAPSRAMRAVLAAGLVAGILDIAYVLVIFGFRGVPPARILQGIAAGLLGRERALAGGATTAALGLGLHFVVALGAATVFYAASRKLRLLVQRPIVGGIVFGTGVWLFMNLVVQPLSANPPKAFPPPQAWIVFLAHLICVGIPIAWIVRKLAPLR